MKTSKTAQKKDSDGPTGVKLTPETKARLAAVAARLEVPVSSILRWGLEIVLDEYEATGRIRLPRMEQRTADAAELERRYEAEKPSTDANSKRHA